MQKPPSAGAARRQMASGTAAFAFITGDRPSIANWLNDVGSFFGTTASAAHEQLNLAFVSSNSPHNKNTLMDADTSKASHQITADDILEVKTVHEMVRLIAVLGHHDDRVRTGSVFLLVALAKIFMPKLTTATVEKYSERIASVTLGLMMAEREYHASVHELFTIIGPAFNAIAIPIVAGLEAFFTCLDSSIRGICITALSRIVFENDRVFLEEDHLAAIWNLYFSLGSIGMMSKVFPDRIVIIKGLGLLAPIYAAVDSSLTYGIVGTLLHLQNKTAFETEEIKITVKQLFDRFPELDKKVPSRDSHAYGTGYNFFLNLLTPHDEFAYDLLPWALENFSTVTYYSFPENKGKPIPISATEQFPALDEFIKSLTNHFRATPALIRYGASSALHTSLVMYPKVAENHPGLLVYILTGILDTDHLAAFLYMSMLESICANGSPNAAKNKTRELIIKFRRQTDDDVVGYDMLYFDADRVTIPPVSGIVRTAPASKEVSISDIFDVATGLTPPIAPKLLHKLLNTFEYLPKRLKLKQLELVRLWGSKSEKFDTQLMQTLFPLLNSLDEDIQLATAHILKALITKFNSAHSADINYAWSHLQSLMKPGTGANLLCSILGLIRDFPLDRLGDEAKEDLLDTLVKVIFHPDPQVRYLAYDIIGSSSDFWKASSLWSTALGVMFLSIGDQNLICARQNIDLILGQIEKVHNVKDLMVPLGLVKDSFGGPLVTTLKAFDDLANAILKDKPKLQELIDALTSESSADTFWYFFLDGVTDSQLVKPDDYDYTKNFIHSPFWISILLTKLSMTPPPLTNSENDRRDVMPTTPANKRRFICGFMLCLLPTCGMPDPILRHAACVATVFTCFRQNVAHPGILRGLMEFVSLQMLNHKQWAFQSSGLDILKLLARVKLPGLSPAILLQYLDLALDVAFNSPSHIVKVGALELLETFLLVFPSGVTTKLPEIRDVVRTLLADEEMEVCHTAARIYPLVFRCVSSNNAQDFYDYLIGEISLIKKGGAELASDPLLAALAQDEQQRIVVQSILALGSISTPSLAYQIIQDLLKFLASEDHDVRYSAFTSISNQMQYLDVIERASIMWVLLPLYADPYKPIRVAFAKVLRKMPSKLDLMLKVILPHTDDSFIMNSVTWEDLLLDGVLIHANMKVLSEIIVDLGLVNSVNSDMTDQLPLEDDGFNLPRISHKLMARIKEIAKTFTTILPSINISQVMYHLLEMQEGKHSQGYSLLVLSELSCAYEAILGDTIDVLVSSLSHDLTAESTHLVQAAALGLKNISELSPPAFKQMLTKVTTAPLPNEGELFNLFYRIDAIRDFSANKAPELLRKYTPLITSHRFSLTKRLYAIYLSVELCLMVGQDEILHVLDALQTFIETADQDNVIEKIHGSISKLLGVVGPKHTIFRTMLGTCRKYIKSKDLELRMKALQIFQIFIKYLSTEEAMTFGMTLLADSNPDIRSKTRYVLTLSGVLDFAIPTLRNAKSYVGTRRGALLETCKLSAISKLGVTVASAAPENDSLAIPMVDKDPFNAKYYGSERRKKFTARYGLDESRFGRASTPVTQSILEGVEDAVLSFHQPSAQTIAKYQWMLNLDTTTLLHECMKQFPEVADQVITAHLQQTEAAIGIKNAEDEEPPEEAGADVENEIHILDVFSNLLIAFDGINIDSTANFIRRLENFITVCNQKATDIREKLYMELENTFYFFNEFIDVPIVSEEQYEALEELKAENQKATLEAVKSGTTDRLSALDMKKVEMDEMLESKSESLRRITILALHATSGYGVYYALSLECEESALTNALKFLVDMLENEHRGIRIAAVEAFLTIAKIQLENGPRPDILRNVQDTVTHFLDKLLDGTELYRRKADYISLIAQLLVHVNDNFVIIKVLVLLVKLWKDPDSEVRIMSIKMVRLLGEVGIPQVMECFRADAVGQNSLDSRPALMPQLTGLLGNPEYLEKEGLQDLLTWRFSQR
ncbi:armadillo-type protein [Obelidium mucronatum]|nr:armadillo-type protein [Obelidium mucronatum]